MTTFVKDLLLSILLVCLTLGLTTYIQASNSGATEIQAPLAQPK